MQPIIIFKEPNSNGKIELTTEEFKKYISDAYEQGKEDGHVVGYYPITTTNPYYYTFTCNAGHASSNAKNAQ